MGDSSDSDWLAPLQRHRQRRQQGVPTVTVFVGPRRVPEWIWIRWHHSVNSRILHVSRAEEILPLWLCDAAIAESFKEAVLTHVARIAAVQRSEISSLVSGRSHSQLDSLANRVAVALELDAPIVGQVLRSSNVDIPTAFSTPGTLVSLTRLIGPLPPVLVRLEDSGESLRDAAHLLFGISESIPASDIGLATDHTSLSGLRSYVSPRVFAGLMEGLVVLQPQGNRAQATSIGCSLEYDDSQFARSRAEMALYERLERRPRTRGLFGLNHKVGRADVGSSLEVDLLCETLKLAIEIDGYHHFLDATAYRRDRRKDVRLQELGYLVVRVLASDVDEEAEHVLEIIDTAVEERRRSQL